MSLIRGALKLQNIHSLAGPFNCNRVRTPSPKDNLIVRVCFIPITYSVIILFLAGATALRVPYICSCTLKKLFCQWQSVEGRASSGWAQRRRRAVEGGDEVGEQCTAVIRTSLGCCMRCAQSAAGESPPNPKVQHVQYDTGPRATGNRRACGCCRAPARKRPVLQISQISRTQGALITARLGP